MAETRKRFDLSIALTARSVEAATAEEARRIIEDALDEAAGKLPGGSFLQFDISASAVSEVKESKGDGIARAAIN